jgi:hypothetical protein
MKRAPVECFNVFAMTGCPLVKTRGVMTNMSSERNMCSEQFWGTPPMESKDLI